MDNGIAKRARGCEKNACEICEYGKFPMILNRRAHAECRRKFILRKLKLRH